IAFIALRSPPTRRSLSPLLVYGAIVLAALVSARTSAERYNVQFVPCAAVLAGVCCQYLWDMATVPGRTLAVLLCSGIAAWPVFTLPFTLHLPEHSQVRAREWCEQRLSQSAVLIQEEFTTNVRTPSDQFAILGGYDYQHAT